MSTQYTARVSCLLLCYYKGQNNDDQTVEYDIVIRGFETLRLTVFEGTCLDCLLEVIVRAVEKINHIIFLYIACFKKRYILYAIRVNCFIVINTISG